MRRHIGWVIGFGLMLGCAMERDDAEIARAVERDLSADLTLSDARIDAASADGEVTLVGEVATAEAKSRAEEIASRVEGVVRVNNELSVAPTAPPVATPPPAGTPPPTEASPPATEGGGGAAPESTVEQDEMAPQEGSEPGAPETEPPSESPAP